MSELMHVSSYLSNSNRLVPFRVSPSFLANMDLSRALNQPTLFHKVLYPSSFKGTEYALPKQPLCAPRSHLLCGQLHTLQLVPRRRMGFCILFIYNLVNIQILCRSIMQDFYVKAFLCLTDCLFSGPFQTEAVTRKANSVLQSMLSWLCTSVKMKI